MEHGKTNNMNKFGGVSFFRPPGLVFLILSLCLATEDTVLRDKTQDGVLSRRFIHEGKRL